MDRADLNWEMQKKILYIETDNLSKTTMAEDRLLEADFEIIGNSSLSRVGKWKNIE